MKRKNLFSTLWTALLLSALISAIPSSVFAQLGATGTPAGTTISSTATVNYKAAVNSTDRSKLSNEVIIMVAYKVSSEIVAGTAPANTTDGTTIYAAFTLTNHGNAPDIFNLTSAHGTGTNPYPNSGWAISFVDGSDATITNVALASGASATIRAKIVITYEIGRAHV